MQKTLVVYGPELDAYDLGDAHPLNPERFRGALAMLRAMGYLDLPSVRMVAPRTATIAELLSVHRLPYIQAVQRAQRIARGLEAPADLTVFGLGTSDDPLFPDIYEASLLLVGAAVKGIEAVLSAEVTHAWSPAGGLHHAHPSYASGFCVFNDSAVAIHRALDEGARVAYVDLDGHHGDGVEHIFAADPRVLTVSLHESGRYLFPGTGDVGERGEGGARGTAVNVPFPPDSGDAVYLAALEDVVGPVLHAFAPDLMVVQTGADSHWADPLTHLATSLRFLPEAVSRLHGWAHELCSGRLLMVGGGGYEWKTVTPRAWAAAFIALLGLPVPAELTRDTGPPRPTVSPDEVRGLLAEARDGSLRLLAQTTLHSGDASAYIATLECLKRRKSMATPKVDPDLCTGCGICEDICPDVFEVGDDGVSHVIDASGCEEAGCCEEAADECPEGAINLE